MSIPDFDKIVWKCPCCNQARTDKYIKVAQHDVSLLFGHETGSMFINCKYCADMPGCQEKAMDHKWVVDHFLGKFADELTTKIAEAIKRS